MFFKIISFLYKLTYYFQPPHNIEIDEQEHRDFNLIGTRGEKLYNVTKYFAWRKYSLFLIIPFLITNISLNIVSFFNIRNNIKKYQNDNQTNYFDNLGFYDNNLDMDFKNSTQEFIKLLNSGKTLDYILFYNIFSSVCIFIEMILISVAIYKANIWYSSKKWIKYSAWFSYFWIYVVYLNPLLHYFKLEYDTNKSITNQTILYSYSFTYILYKLLMEVLPLSLCIFTSLMWSASNIKCLFPESIYIGWVYSYANVLFFFTSGTLLLIINQLINDIKISIIISIFILGLYISNYLYGQKLKYYFKYDFEVFDSNFKLNLLKNVIFAIYSILGVVFLMLYDNPLNHGIYKFFKTDIAYLITKFIYRIIYYKILCSDILVGWILYTEKYRDVYKDELLEFTNKVKYIERQLYEDKYYNVL